ncbi:unnamed protein product [Amoebophrya sp. A120]|nr:unnamed protein product [Amoebophrya sp. A120]|eukprot:GSA120T00023134001.1
MINITIYYIHYTIMERAREGQDSNGPRWQRPDSNPDSKPEGRDPTPMVQGTSS